MLKSKFVKWFGVLVASAVVLPQAEAQCVNGMCGRGQPSMRFALPNLGFGNWQQQNAPVVNYSNCPGGVCPIQGQAANQVPVSARKFSEKGDHLVFVYLGTQLIGCYDTKTESWHARKQGFSDQDPAGYAEAVELRLPNSVTKR